MLGHVLRPDELLSRATYGDAAPDARLAPWVQHYWSVQWEFGPGETFRTATLDDPSLNLTLERGDLLRAGQTRPGVWLTGPVTHGRFDVTLFGTGSVVGIKFQIGGVRGFVDADLAGLRDRTVTGEGVLPGVEVEWAGFPHGADEAAPALDAWLLGRQPVLGPAYARFREVLAMLDDPGLTGLDDLAERAGCDVRSLQRMFRRFAGVGPKRMLMRARVIDAVAALDRGWDGSLADLAHELGWFDQAHFTRDFRAITGETPSAYGGRGSGVGRGVN
ncbi:helix-turn-helix domain-containing protein [Mariniluteicoccus flavus]